MTSVSVRSDSPDGQKKAPPDGGWGWVVVFASFMVHLIADGITSCFALFFVKIVQEYDETKRNCAWIGSILIGVTYATGPIASLLVRCFQCRVVTMMGSLIAAFGFGISYYATSPTYLYVSIGLCGGFGLGLVYLTAIVSVSSYFEKRLSLATGLAVCGSGLGSVVLAPVFDFLISYMGWRKALLGASALLVSSTFFGALFRPLPTDESSDFSKKRKSFAGYRRGSLIPNVTTYSEESHKPSKNHLPTIQECPDSVATVPCDDKYQEKMMRDLALFQAVRRASLEDPRLMMKFAEMNGLNISNSTSKQKKEPKCWTGILTRLKSWKGLELVMNPLFILVVFVMFCTDVGYNVPNIYFSDLTKVTLKVEDKDNDPRLGWIISIVGGMSTASRIILGYLADKMSQKRLYLYCLSCVLCGTATVLSPLGDDFTWLATCAMGFGFTGGTYVSLTSVILVDLMGADMLSDAFGIVLLFQGIGTLIGPPIVGYLYDTFHTYSYGFLFAGLSMAVSSLLLLLVPLFQKSKPTFPGPAIQGPTIQGSTIQGSTSKDKV